MAILKDLIVLNGSKILGKLFAKSIKSDTIEATNISGPLTGNADTASKWKTARNINGLSIDGSTDVVNYGICSTAAATVAKVVSCAGFTLVTGAVITVKFTVTNTASKPTLNVNGTGAKLIYYRGEAITPGYLAANRTYEFRYNGTQYDLVGDIDTNTTYTSLKNPYALTVQFNGTTNSTYDGSAAATVNVTPSGIGAAESSHTHNYAGSSSAGGVAMQAAKTTGTLTLSLNDGSTTTNTTFNGSSSVTASVAAASHTHSAYSVTSHTHTSIQNSTGVYKVDISSGNLLPVGTVNLGSSTSAYSNIYGATIYEGGTSLSSKYAAASHTHNYAGSTSAGGAANLLYLPRVTSSANYQPGGNRIEIKEFSNTSTNIPSAHWYHIFTGQGSDANYNTQLALGITTQAAYYRYRNSGTWGAWKQIAFVDSSITGNAATATKLGTATVGGSAKPIYLNAGTPTACSSTVGSATQPVYMNAGTVTACSTTVGSTDTPVYMNAGAITSTGKSFSNYLPLSGGTIDGSLTITGTTKVKGNGLELYYTTPYIDFHYNNNSEKDYTSRLIEPESGLLQLHGNFAVSGYISKYMRIFNTGSTTSSSITFAVTTGDIISFTLHGSAGTNIMILVYSSTQIVLLGASQIPSASVTYGDVIQATCKVTISNGTLTFNKAPAYDTVYYIWWCNKV